MYRSLYLSLSISIFVYIRVYVYVCVCMCESVYACECEYCCVCLTLIEMIKKSQPHESPTTDHFFFSIAPPITYKKPKGFITRKKSPPPHQFGQITCHDMRGEGLHLNMIVCFLKFKRSHLALQN